MPLVLTETGEADEDWVVAFRRLNETNGIGLAMTLMPPTIAVSICPLRSACTAWCRATSEDEQAVSSVTLGPCRSKM